MSDRDLAPCPCGSGAPYARCCEPYHRGAEPGEPELLMRARFSAFARGEHRFLYRTLHPDHDDRARSERELTDALAKRGRRTRYRSLRILDRDVPDADGVAHVLFAVDVAIAGRDASFVELSSFARDAEGWRYVGGRTIARREVQDLDALTIASFPQ